MSASSKKKLRNEQEAAKLTEKQLTEQKEAKKLKLYTTIFTVVLAAIVVIAAVTGVSQVIRTSGIREKNTVAVTIGTEELSNAELNYYYIDAVNQFYSNYGTYATLFGMDVNKPLNEQIVNEETGATWADDFTESAIANAKATLALVAEAKAKGHTLTEAETAQIETNLSSLDMYSVMYGYSSGEDYLKAMYGRGASMESYRAYCEANALASSYYNAYGESLTYDDAALRASEAENPNQYNAYTYNSYYLNVNNFLEGGTTSEDGTTTYSDEEKANAVKAAEAAAKELTGDEITSVADLDAAIAALSINAESETPVSSTAYEDQMYTSVSTVIAQWLADENRKAGDLAYLVNESTTTAEDGTETTTVNGYYVVYFHSVNDNTFPLANVRHILVSFEGGSYDSSTGITTYNDEEKLAAHAKAEDLLAQWKSSGATEDNFASMANEHSTDPGSNTNGGLYEDVFPGQMVTAFNDWCFDDARKAGDTGIVETDYGCHIMFYSGDSETNYRDFMIASNLRSADLENWYSALVESASATKGNTQYLSNDLVLSGN